MANPNARLTRRALIGAGAIAALGNGARAAARFTLHQNVKAALQARQSGLFKIAGLGVFETILLCVNGAPVDIHTRRNGLYQRKDAARSHSLRDVAPVDFNRLITAAGGLDAAVNGTPRAAGFYALYNAMAAISADAFAIVPVSGEADPRLAFSADPFFAGWSFSYDARSGAYAFTAGNIRAHWILEGQP
jgi:hypothetical protein